MKSGALNLERVGAPLFRLHYRQDCGYQFRARTEACEGFVGRLSRQTVEYSRAHAQG